MVRPPGKLARHRVFKRRTAKNRRTTQPRHSCRSRTIYPAELQPHIYENRRWDEIHRMKFVKAWSEKYMVVISWSDHRGNWCDAGFSNDASPKIGKPCHRVTVVGAERSIQQSCGRIRADAAERRSSANNIIADLGQKCNPKNQRGRKTRAAGHTSPKTSRNRQTAPDSRAARCGGGRAAVCVPVRQMV